MVFEKKKWDRAKRSKAGCLVIIAVLSKLSFFGSCLTIMKTEVYVCEQGGDKHISVCIEYNQCVLVIPLNCDQSCDFLDVLTDSDIYVS